MKIAAIVKTYGEQFPGEVERVYRLRAGNKGTGRIIKEHRARGNYRADDAAMADMHVTAMRLGYAVADRMIDKTREGY